MSAPPWFHLDPMPAPGETAELAARETRHAAGARRLAVGDALGLFDGSGLVADADIVEIDSAVIVRVTGQRRIEPLRPAIHLACALPKGDRQATLLSMATQLGVASFTPLACRRGVAKAGSGFADRAGRICREACKQSRNPHLPRIEASASPADAVRPGDAAIVAHPDGGSSMREWLAEARHGGVASVTVLVGPEGGFTEDEVAAIVADGAEPVDLGPGILRIETAAVALVAAIRVAW